MNRTVRRPFPLRRWAGAAVVVAAGLLLPAGPTAGSDADPPGARPPAGDAGASAGDAGLARLEVVESLGIAAVMGVVTRVPAESPGGGAYNETQITAVKALGRAAGAYPGPLGEAFLGTSVEAYRNPSMVVAQQPPGLFPAEARAEGGQAGPQGTVGLIRAAAASRSEVEAEVVMGAGPSGAPIEISGGVSRSRSRVEPDGTVVTEVESSFGRAVVAGVLEMVGGASRALARTPAGGQPVLQLDSTLGAMTLNGVGVRMGGDGLVMADQPLASPDDVARFNAGLATLRQAGITLEAVPTERRDEPGQGRISGAAGLFRYQLPSNPIPNSIGNDEAFLLAQVSAAAAAVPRTDAGLPPLDLPGAGPVLPGPSVAAAPTPPAAVAGAAPLTTGTGPVTSAARTAQASFPLLGAGRATPVGLGVGAPAGTATGAGGAATAETSPAPSEDAGPVFDGSRLALPASAERSLVASVTGFYAVLLFLGAAAVLILLGLHKARTA